MADDEKNISVATWARAADPITKAGFMDGAAAGQSSTFQSSFDTGYKQGFEFGLKLGIKHAVSRYKQKSMEPVLTDQRKINCKICENSNSAQDSVINLYNRQREANEPLMC